MKKFALKSEDASKEKVASLLQFTDDDISETSADELVGMVALLNKRMADISLATESLRESSGLNEIETELSNIKEMIKKINSAILRSNLLDNDEKVLVNVRGDGSVIDAEHHESEDNIEMSNMFVKDVSYSVADSVSFGVLLDKLADLNILGSVKIGGVSVVTALTVDEFRDLKSKLEQYNLLCAFNISKVSFNADMKAYPDARQSLLDAGYIVEDASIKMKKASNRQMSLFDSEDETALDVVPNSTEEGNNNADFVADSNPISVESLIIDHSTLGNVALIPTESIDSSSTMNPLNQLSNDRR